MDLRREILKSIDILMDEKLKYLRFNHKLEGVISEVVNPNTYKVNVQGKMETITSMNNDTYELSDVVYILVFNGNYSDKRILCKK